MEIVSYATSDSKPSSSTGIRPRGASQGFHKQIWLSFTADMEKLSFVDDSRTINDLMAVFCGKWGARSTGLVPARHRTLHEPTKRLFKAIREKVFKRQNGAFVNEERLWIDNGHVVFEASLSEIKKLMGHGTTAKQLRLAREFLGYRGWNVIHGACWRISRTEGSVIRWWLDARRLIAIYELLPTLIALPPTDRLSFFNEIYEKTGTRGAPRNHQLRMEDASPTVEEQVPSRADGILLIHSTQLIDAGQTASSSTADSLGEPVTTTSTAESGCR